MRSYSLINTALLSCLLLLCGCSEEQSPGTLPIPGGITLRYTIDNLTVGKVDDASTYAGTILVPTPDEAKVEELIMLFFEVSDVGNGAYVGYAQADANDISNPTVPAWEMHTTQMIPPSGTPVAISKDYSVMAIANYTTNGLALDAIKAVAETGNATERSVKYALVTDNATTISSPFLMSGFGRYSGKEQAVTIALRRNVAKVKVIDAIDDGVFRLEKVWVGNMRAKSYAMDMRGEMPVEILEALNQPKDVEMDAGIGKNAASLYCFETYTEMAGPREKTTLCLVLQGLYRGFTKYYRVDVNLHEVDPVNERFVQRINRNALYQITLVGVTGGGMDTPEEALAGAADQLVVREDQFWDEGFDGIYSYASNDIGFAASTNQVEKRFLKLAGAEESEKAFSIDLYWNKHYSPLGDSELPTVDEIKVSSSDETIVKVGLTDNKKITGTVTGFGETTLTIEYSDAIVRHIPVRILSYIESNVKIDNILVASRNAGVSPETPLGKLYSFSELNNLFSLKQNNVCPTGWRLPVRSEILRLYLGGIITFTENGFLITDPIPGTELVTLFPYAGQWDVDTKILSGVGTEAYYWTGSLENGQRVVYTGTAESKKMVTTTVGNNSTTKKCFSVRCVAILDSMTDYTYMDPDDKKSYNVVVTAGTLTYDEYANAKPEGYDLAGTAMTKKILENGGLPPNGTIAVDSWYWGDDKGGTKAASITYQKLGVLKIDENYEKATPHSGLYIKRL